MLAVLSARGPVVATFHTAMTRSRTMAAAQGVLQIVLEKITARIAVSALARKVQVEHLDGGAWEIPNGVAVAQFAGADRCPAGRGRRAGQRRHDRLPRPVHRGRARASRCCADAFAALAADRPGLRLLVAGPGDPDELYEQLPPELRDRVTFLGKVSEEDKARMLRSVDVYVAPNTGGESFGMILTEAMAAGTAVVASDLDAFRRVLDGGRAGLLFPTGDADGLRGRPDRAARRPGPPGRVECLRRRRWSPATTGRWWPRGCSRSTSRDRGHRRPGHRPEWAGLGAGAGVTVAIARTMWWVVWPLRCRRRAWSRPT